MQRSNGRHVLVLGHSLISRLRDFTNDNIRMNNFGFVEDSVCLVGFSGGTLDVLNSQLRHILTSDTKYYAICLQIGGNDLSRPENTVVKVHQSILRLIHLLKNMYLIRNIFICQLFKRSKTRKYKNDVSVEEYNIRVEQLNDLLINTNNIQFWKHDAYIWNPFELYGSDGVHFKNMKPYYKSMKGCVLNSLSL